MDGQNLREAYGKKLVELGSKNKNIVVLDADLSKSTSTTLFEKNFPDRYFEIGIAEQNMVSIGVGLSLTGKIVFLNSFAVFLTGRAYDQIRVGVALGKANIKLIGSSAGLSDYDDGATHQSFEDISLMRSLPNMRVIVPSDAIETQKMTEFIANSEGPFYVRLNKQNLPTVFNEKWEFKLGKLYEMRKGTDIVIFTNGVMITKSLSAAKLLENQGINTEVINVSTIKPLNSKSILEIATNFKKVIVAEEHSIYGGLGSSICELLVGIKNISIKVIGIKDQFGRSACNYDDLLDFYGLTEKNIINAVEDILKR